MPPQCRSRLRRRSTRKHAPPGIGSPVVLFGFERHGIDPIAPLAAVITAHVAQAHASHRIAPAGGMAVEDLRRSEAVDALVVIKRVGVAHALVVVAAAVVERVLAAFVAMIRKKGGFIIPIGVRHRVRAPVVAALAGENRLRDHDRRQPVAVRVFRHVVRIYLEHGIVPMCPVRAPHLPAIRFNHPGSPSCAACSMPPASPCP